ncbi:bifunctional phosphoribosyl-AMP cyclohydrolase/phosphoribosyl-ATP diphosphatase HisIE [Marivirga sp.]|uniref:bifunctional phosphoribosyl-AMP cyclohydrolase/phosphoribosyl-ATP diphosphatase HisIE n=1 Tax=Marivirga sp. TaxID=2018662 RepID=UPI002D8040FD|nr:bifunctional phosphoribosyl-AMP cyclohydrolase/phosphoribosyl-ATP diphosphatase HisIE [Marivirga sp.]HET8860375.1 bifunctional phosphoribosyl-AMP cyclohydrolase/phosphoribosyl-ATP diphosphatase HisIE [Marivirga sp.]
MQKPDFSKGENGLLPAVIQDAVTGKVLMLGYMNEEALGKTQSSGKVTFYSRSKNRLWMKGESSSNFLNLVDISLDCDQDTFLIKVNPDGPTCHTGADTCWDEKNEGIGFIDHLESVIEARKNGDSEKSYVKSLFDKGINKIAQKVGEEAVEVVIEAKDDNEELFLNESADLLFHYLILLQAKGYKLQDVVKILEERHR